MSKKKLQADELKQAVDQIPSLLFKEMAEKNSPSPPHTHQNAHPVYHSPAHSKKWLLTGVLICSICILGFWVLYISNLIYENRTTLNPIRAFTDSGLNNFSDLTNTFSALEAELGTDVATPQELKNMVSDALLPLFISTSTTSTTSTPPIDSPTTTTAN
jgi:cytoskeletal protein RodZ